MASLVVSPPAVAFVLEKLKDLKGGAGSKWTALCPAHEDHEPSLSVRVSGEKILMNCHRGCTVEAIVFALGLQMSDLFLGAKPENTNGAHPVAAAQGVADRQRLIRTYDYVDADGELVFQACRFGPKKRFKQRRPDGNGGWIYNLDGVEPVLYRLPEVIDAVAHERTVYIVEGEKDADALNELRYVATTSPMGAGKWRESYADVLAGANVIIFPDNDDVGRAHATQIAASLVARDCIVRVVELPNLPPKGDFSDWIERPDADLDELAELIDRTPRWSADSALGKVKTRWRLDELWENEAIMRPPPPVVPYLAWTARTTLLAAREKSGKSTLTGFIAAQVSTGGDFLGEPCQRGRVLILGLEEYIGDTARRLKQFCANGRMIELVDRFIRSPEERLDEVRSHLEAVDPTLVVLDSLIAFGRGVITDANNATQTQAIVQGLADLSHTSGAAWIITHHARKADGRYRDSSAIGGAVDVIAEIFTPEDTEKTDPNRRRVRPIGRVPAHLVDFRFTGEGYELVTAGEKGPLDQRILAAVQDGPGRSASTIADLVGERRQEVLSRITQMIASGLLINDGDARKTKLRRPMFPPAAAIL